MGITLASVKLTLTPTPKWYTRLLMVDTQLSTLLLMAMFIRLEYTELLSQQCQLIHRSIQLQCLEPSPIPILVLIMEKWNDLPNGTNIINNRKLFNDSNLST